MSASSPGRNRRFALGTLLLTLAVPGTLLAAGPLFGEVRSAFGVAVAWGVALAIMVPSYLLVVRCVESTDTRRFLQAFLLGTLLRLVATVAAVVLFVTLVEQAPVRTFVLTFFLGYMLLTGLELVVTVRGRSHGVKA